LTTTQQHVKAAPHEPTIADCFASTAWEDDNNDWLLLVTSRHIDFFAALHWMQGGLVKRKLSVCRPVRLYVCQTRALWQNGRKIFFSLGVTVEALWANIGPKIGDFAPTGASWPKISGRRGRPHQPFYFSENWAKWFFVWYKNLDRSFFRFVTMHAFDRQTDRQTAFFWPDRPAFNVAR